jgi:hypothetical protein
MIKQGYCIPCMKLSVKKHKLKACKTPRLTAKLTEDQVREIKPLIGKYTCVQLGKMYGVAYATISKINRHITWKNIK